MKQKHQASVQSAIVRESKYVYFSSMSNIEKIRILLSLHRCLAFDSSLLAVLHGSAAITNKGNAILFGDGIDCKGKTMSALMTANSSQKFLADECVIYNEATGSVYGNNYYPLLIRQDVYKIISKRFDLDCSGKTTLALPAELGFKVPELTNLKAIISPHIDSDLRESYLKEENQQKIKFYKVALTANAHAMKFIDESLDHVQSDGDKNNNNRKEIIDRVVGLSVPNGLLKLPYYDAYLKESSDIVELLQKEEL